MYKWNLPKYGTTDLCQDIDNGNQGMPMPAPYSYDLRTKVIDAVKRGEPKSKVSRMFNISRNTLDLWLKREQETGTIKQS